MITIGKAMEKTSVNKIARMDEIPMRKPPFYVG